MATLKRISLSRTLIRAWRLLTLYFVLILVFGAMGGLYWLYHALRNGVAHADFSLAPLEAFATLMSCPAGGALLAAAWRYHKACWPRKLGSIVSTLRRVPIASAPRDGSNAVAIEGVVAPVADGASLMAPVSGAACVYYWVRIEHQNPAPWPGLVRSDWWVLDDRAKLRSFVVADDSGFVRVEPLLDRADPSIPSIEPVDFDLAIATRATVHESAAGFAGLPPSARAYIEGELADRAELWREHRLRVTEVYLRAGDVVSVFGRIKDRIEGAGAFRTQGTEHLGVLSGFPAELRVVPASLAELRWLRRFDLAVVVFLVSCAVLAWVAFVLGMARMSGGR